ncbi:SDR family NAD(P)-dependent oxidoreductase [Leucobacter chromiiresistens]|uniref:Short-chain dehydrogenase n=1 Tax=Leucobacter chromiiresistens TaxID=1079994 RepID=A0A147ERH0_9MICO|nr:SDR family NAD(P)-dependent oxidoreductase [Leucobacter chromiiresistens]KTR86992.1 short-chain dehydrogenase [Leucobacter chromiiresistens]
MHANGRTIVITGASDGIGAAAARRLHRDGHRVVLVGRSPDKTRAIAAELGAPFHLADFADLSQVRALAAALLAEHDRIDVLANNAGGIMGDRTVTVDGHELTFQVNHLAPFLLTRLLMPALVAGRATVVQTASLAARAFSRFDIADLQNARRYAPQRAYGNAKLANILFTAELQRRHGAEGISAVAFHPGVVASSFASDTTHLMRLVYHTPLKRLFTISADAGADQLVWLAEGTPGSTFTPGAYYESRAIAVKVSPEVHDPELARELWEQSLALVGETP